MIFVTAIWILLILGAMVLLYARSMRVEVLASGNDYGSIYARNLELGAEQWVMSLVDNQQGNAVQIQTQGTEAVPLGTGYFWILNPDLDNPQNYVYTVTDESSKLNVNVATEAQLVALPNMTYAIADSIMNWVGPDPSGISSTSSTTGATGTTGTGTSGTATKPPAATPTASSSGSSSTTGGNQGQGAQADYYSSLPRPYTMKYSAFETPEELLLVQGVDPILMWNIDLNRNGVLDVAEGSPQLSTNGIDASRGINPFVTIWTIETNLDASGMTRINVNTALQSSATGGVRTGGSTGRAAGGSIGAVTTTGGGAAAGRGTTGGAAGAAGGATGAAAGGGTTQQALLQALETGMTSQRAQQIITAATPYVSGGQQFANVFDFANKAGMKPEELKPILDRLTTVTSSTRQGLVNVNTASAAVLTALGLDQGDAQTLVNARQSADTNTANGPDMSWVVDALPLSKLAQIGTQLTGRSFFYSADIVAVTGDGRAFRRVKIVVNARNTPPKIVYRKDLTEYGWPLDPAILDSLKQGQGLPAGVVSSTSTIGQTSGTTGLTGTTR
jgi:DNA uptake protein ComE-like DNA-binding protein